MSFASNQKGRCIINQAINQSCIKSYEGITGLIFKFVLSRFNVKTFDVSNNGSRNTARMGAQHCFTYRHPINYRTNGIPGIKMQGFGVTIAHPDTEDDHFYTTVIIHSGKYG